MLLQLVPNASGLGRADRADDAWPTPDSGSSTASAREINGLDAYVGTYQGELQGLGNVGTLAAHIVHDGSVYCSRGSRPPNQFERVAAAVRRAHPFVPRV